MLFNRKQLSVLLIFLYLALSVRLTIPLRLNLQLKKSRYKAPLPRSGFVILMSDITLNLLINKGKKSWDVGTSSPPTSEKRLDKRNYQSR